MTQQAAAPVLNGGAASQFSAETAGRAERQTQLVALRPTTGRRPRSIRPGRAALSVPARARRQSRPRPRPRRQCTWSDRVAAERSGAAPMTRSAPPTPAEWSDRYRPAGGLTQRARCSVHHRRPGRRRRRLRKTDAGKPGAPAPLIRRRAICGPWRQPGLQREGSLIRSSSNGLTLRFPLL